MPAAWWMRAKEGIESNIVSPALKLSKAEKKLTLVKGKVEYKALPDCAYAQRAHLSQDDGYYTSWSLERNKREGNPWC